MDAVEIITIAKASIDPQVCYSPYFTLCDSETVVPITDEGFKRDLEDRCRDRSVRFCELNDDDGSSSIPSNIPDGYYNYYVPKSRESNDYLSKISESFYSYNFADMNISSVEKDLVTVQTEVDNINKRIQESKSKVGYGDDSTDFGPDGELFALHDQCLEMSSGKYTYHLCMFQKAKQTESGRGGGVDLGKWDGMSFYQETGQRVMKWKGGSKCWNGPMRSATVFVTCGIETKLVSAEEPNICEYEFRLESPIACDDTFRDTHDL
jgi:protein kinase C substrate 80K-H